MHPYAGMIRIRWMGSFLAETSQPRIQRLPLRWRISRPESAGRKDLLRRRLGAVAALDPVQDFGGCKIVRQHLG